jgi:indole-3-acetate monooxygenase
MYPDLCVGTAVSVTPLGRAERVPDGWRVSGRFPFASGSQHCDWFWLGCTVPGSGTSGLPETRQCVVPASQCRILDTWRTTGLCGTGSNDILVEDLIVPDEHTFSFQDPHIVKRNGPLYALPLMFIAKGPAPALGIARHVVDALVEMVCQKPARRFVCGDRLEPALQLRDQVFVQDAVGRAETILAAARAHLFTTLGDVWSTLVQGQVPSPEQMALFLSTNTYVMGLCVDVVQLACKAAGGTAVYRTGPFDRCRRDVLTMNQHMMATSRMYEVGGRMLLDMEPLRLLL